MLNSHIIDSVKIGSRYYVTGNTYPRRAELKAAGFRWDPEQRAWWTPSAKEANRIVDALWAEHRKAEAARYAAEQKAHEGYRWTWKREQWRDDTGKWAVWHDMDDDDDMYDGISGFSGGWFGWEKIEKPAPETRKISLAKLAQAAAARLAAAAEAKAEAAKAAEPARKISLRPVVEAAVKGAAHAVRSARARKGWETRRRNAAAKAEAVNASCAPLDATACAPAPFVTPCAVAGTHCAATERDYCGTRSPLHSAVIFRCPPAAAFNAIGERACTEPGTWQSKRTRRNARRRELYRLRKAA